MLAEVKSEIDIFTNEMRMNEKMIKDLESKEFLVLKWIYDKANGVRDELVELNSLFEENTDYNEKEIENISDYLEGEGFIEQPYDSGLVVILTHKGIKEVRNPNQLKKQSPSSSTLHIYGSVGNIGDNSGIIQQGNQNTANFQQNFGSKAKDVINLLSELREHISEEKKQEGEEYIEGLEAEVKSAKPSESRIKLFLRGLGGVIKDTGKELFIEVGKKVITGEIQFPNL